MKKPVRVAVSGAVATAGPAVTLVCVILLARQGLDRAEKILSIASCLFTVAGFALSLLAWRRTAPALPEAPSTTSSGPAPAGGVHATGAGAVAVGGDNSGRIRTRATGR